MAKYQAREQTDLPNFIKIFGHGDAGAGFLGPRYQGFSLSPEGRFDLLGFNTAARTAAAWC